MDTSAAQEEVTEIDRTIRTVKERNRYTITSIPFNYLHKLLITKIVYFSVL